MESPSRVTTQSGSFLCTAVSTTPIRVVTKEVRYIHELSLTLEHSMPVSSPAVRDLTPTAEPMFTIYGKALPRRSEAKDSALIRSVH